MAQSTQNVSRETIGKLEHFENLVRKWTPKINLVAKSTVDDLWDRHIADSIQIFSLAKHPARWVDFGTGGGFPGLVVAILADQENSEQETILIESDTRKSTFLRTVARELSLQVKVINERIESVAPLEAEVVSARALADLTTLLQFADLHLKPSGSALFMKGGRWKNEHDAAQSRWSYKCEAIKSQTNPESAILRIKEVSRV